MIKTRNFYSWHTLEWRCVWHISVCLLSLQDLTRSIQTNQVVNKFNRFPFTVLVSPVNNHIKWLQNIELPPLFLNSYWRLKILLPSNIDPPPTRFSFSNGRGGGRVKILWQRTIKPPPIEKSHWRWYFNYHDREMLTPQPPLTEITAYKHYRIRIHTTNEYNLLQ